MPPPTLLESPISRRWPSWGLTAGLLTVVAVAMIARMLAHPLYLHHHESLMVPTVGRELLHGHLTDWFYFQYNTYQGGILVDGLLAAFGFAVFGDVEWAWKWSGVAYFVALAALGMHLLGRTFGRLAATYFALLLAAAPFLVKDGIATAPGHHSYTFVYALAALAVAVPPPGGRPSPRRALAAGALAGFALWYGRPALAVLPALAIGLAPGGWRALAACAAGGLSFPFIAAANSFMLARHVPRYEQIGWANSFHSLLFSLRATPGKLELGPKLTEVSVRPLEPLLFAQPLPGLGQPAPRHLVFDHAASAWSIGWMAGLIVLLIVIVLAINEERTHRRIPWGPIAVLALPVGYAALYVLSPFRIDASLLQGSVQGTPPDLDSPRYLVPVMLGWTLALAAALGTSSRPGRPWIVRLTAMASLTTLVLLGGAAAATDWQRDRAPAGLHAQLKPFDYDGMWGPYSGPPESVHKSCQTTDPISRNAHLGSLGAFFTQQGLWSLVGEPAQIPERLDQLREELSLTEEELGHVGRGLGLALASGLDGTEGLAPAHLLTALWPVLDDLSPKVGSELLSGLADIRPDPDLLRQPGLLCATTPWGSRPLCPLVGRWSTDDRHSVPPDDPRELFDPPLPYPLDSDLGLLALREAGTVLGIHLSSPDDARKVISSWPLEQAAAFTAGWEEHAGRRP